MNDNEEVMGGLSQNAGQAQPSPAPQGGSMLGPILFGLGAAGLLAYLLQRSKSDIAYVGYNPGKRAEDDPEEEVDEDDLDEGEDDSDDEDDDLDEDVQDEDEEEEGDDNEDDNED